MGLYQSGIVGAEEKPPAPLVVVSKEKAGDNFWTVIKWVGGALVIVTGYREARNWWRSKLGTDEGEGTE